MSQKPDQTLPLPAAGGAEFSLALARALAREVQAAYEHSEILGMTTDTQLTVVEYANAIVVAVPGTSSMRDVLTDIRIKLRGLPQGRVHRGVYAAGEDVLDRLCARLKALPRKPIVVGGHSLGKGIGGYVAWYLARAGWNVAAVYSFGGMRWCDRKFAKDYDARLGAVTWRICFVFDLVPHLPLPGFLLRYWHEGRIALVTTWKRKDGSRCFRAHLRPRPDSLWQSLRTLARAGWLLAHRPTPAQLDQMKRDHGMAGYCERLEQLQGTQPTH